MKSVMDTNIKQPLAISSVGQSELGIRETRIEVSVLPICKTLSLTIGADGSYQELRDYTDKRCRIREKTCRHSISH